MPLARTPPPPPPQPVACHSLDRVACITPSPATSLASLFCVTHTPCAAHTRYGPAASPTPKQHAFTRARPVGSGALRDRPASTGPTVIRIGMASYASSTQNYRCPNGRPGPGPLGPTDNRSCPASPRVVAAAQARHAGLVVVMGRPVNRPRSPIKSRKIEKNCA
jgi:hypothetical protein